MNDDASAVWGALILLIFMLVMCFIGGFGVGEAKGLNSGLDAACVELGYQESEIRNDDIYCVSFGSEQSIVKLSIIRMSELAVPNG